jgi:hypothetical protein
MGQAKIRGTREQRVQQAVDREAQEARDRAALVAERKRQLQADEDEYVSKMTPEEQEAYYERKAGRRSRSSISSRLIATAGIAAMAMSITAR